MSTSRSFARTLAGAFDHADALARDLDRALEKALANRDILVIDGVSYGRALARDLDRARGLAAAVAGDLDRAHDLARNLAGPRRGKAGRGPRAWRVTASAQRLADAAVWLLPAADRPRYREEYGSELWEIATERPGRRPQVQHAARLVVRAVPLRLAMLAPRSRKAPL